MCRSHPFLEKRVKRDVDIDRKVTGAAKLAQGENGVRPAAFSEGNPQDRRLDDRQCGVQAALQGDRGHLDWEQLDRGGQAVLWRPHQLPGKKPLILLHYYVN